MKLSQAVRVLRWNERILTLLGIWPHSLNDVRLAFILSYLIIHLSLEYADLFQFINSLEHVVANLTENVMFTTIVCKVILLRLNNRKLGLVIEAVKEDFQEKNYETPAERRVFLAYYKRVRTFFLIHVLLIVFLAISYYLAPLVYLLGAVNRNETLELNLPYHTRMFYDVSETHVYALTYAAQSPFIFIAAFAHTGADCLIVTLMLHICGQLSVLVERINHLSTDPKKCGPAIGKLVKTHVRLISMAMKLAEAYKVILLAQLLGGMVLMCILSFNLLANAKEGEAVDIFNFLLYLLGVILLIYVYCAVGESLIQESNRVHRAFSDCGWNEMPTQCAKLVIICMARSQYPLQLTAGNFYTFSMKSFANIVKTSMAYLSVLRNLL